MVTVDGRTQLTRLVTARQHHGMIAEARAEFGRNVVFVNGILCLRLQVRKTVATIRPMVYLLLFT